MPAASCSVKSNSPVKIMVRLKVLNSLHWLFYVVILIERRGDGSITLFPVHLAPGFYNGYLYRCDPSHVVTLFAPDGLEILNLPIQSAGIDIRDFYGNVVRAIDTGTYIPAHLSFGEDHSLWSVGWQRRASTATLREFARGLEPGSEEWQERRITVTSDRAGIEAISGNVSNQREWVELDLNGVLKGRWKLSTDDFREWF
jgi:hypothetical protein